MHENKTIEFVHVILIKKSQSSTDLHDEAINRVANLTTSVAQLGELVKFPSVYHIFCFKLTVKLPNFAGDLILLILLEGQIR